VLFKAGKSSLELTSAMLNGGVMVRPGDNFGAPGCVRLTIGTKDANERFWEVLQEIIR
jgi:histidinol-phosphate aminotransferase